MFKNIKNRIAFLRRVDILWEPDYEELELEEFPTMMDGGFAPWRIDEFLRLAKLHPEFHIVTCIDSSLYINNFVWGGQTYHLAQGDADPHLVHDRYGRLDMQFLQSLNSERKRRIA
jgi:hypothetical protein